MPKQRGGNRDVGEHGEKTEMRLPTESNCKMFRVSEDKAELTFPSDGVMHIGRNEFLDFDEFWNHIAANFPSVTQHGSRGTLSCRGTYVRVDEHGQPVFTFGDPILDAVTDENGAMVIGGRRFDLRADDLAGTPTVGGGIASVDLGRHGQSLLDAQIADAVSETGRFTLLESSDEAIVLATRNPSEMWFYQPTDTSKSMRFRAFNKNYWLYWKRGAEIQTWNSRFSTAQIGSQYGWYVASTACAVAKYDSDSDTNDSYVNEYEWGTPGTNVDGALHLCSATWFARTYGGYVSTGGCTLWF